MAMVESKLKATSGSFLPWKKLDLFDILFKQIPLNYRPQDAILHSLVGVVLLIAIVMGIINASSFHFTVIQYPDIFITAVPGLAITWVLGLLCYQRYPRLGLFISSFSQCFLYVIVVGYALAITLTTPFPIIDKNLLHFDAFFKFSTLGLMNWTYQHSWLTSWLNFCYDTWFFQLLLTPLLLALFKDRVETDRYMIATFVSFIIGMLIYYFFPTIAPSGVLQSPHFTEVQYDLVQRFREVHQSLPVSDYTGGGMIAFPSFHVINSLIVLYAWRRYAWIFLPLLIVNIFSIFATMGLGFHYLADVFSGFAIAYLSVKFSTYLIRRYC